MGQQNSRKSSTASACGSCGCSERRVTESSQVQRYVSALTDRWSSRDCVCRRRRPACVCTAYRRVNETCHDDRLAAVLELRREIDAIVNINDSESRESGDQIPEVYVLSVATRNSVESDSSQENRRSEIQSTTDASYRIHPHFQVVSGSELRALLLRAPQSSPTPPHKIHTQVDYIHCLVPDLQEITACSYYWGKMDRYEAERLLDGKPEGTFLLRDSAQEEHLFSVSFRKYGRSLHARVEHHHKRFSFDSHDPNVFASTTVTGLLDHYKDPACVMFFEPMLSAPLPRSTPFGLQQLARAVIVSHISYDGVESLPLPPRLRAFLKEYHYRQRVRVRRLDSDALYHCS